MAVGDFDLTDDDVAAIDRAGAKGELWDQRKAQAMGVGKWIALVGLLGYAGFRTFA